jgi:hypothetical protein
MASDHNFTAVGKATILVAALGPFRRRYWCHAYVAGYRQWPSADSVLPALKKERERVNRVLGNHGVTVSPERNEPRIAMEVHVRA